MQDILNLLVSASILSCFRLNSQPTNNADACQSLASKAISADRLKVRIILQFTCCKSFAQNRKIFLQDAGSVIRYLKRFDAPRLHRHLNTSRLCV